MEICFVICQTILSLNKALGRLCSVCSRFGKQTLFAIRTQRQNNKWPVCSAATATQGKDGSSWPWHRHGNIGFSCLTSTTSPATGSFWHCHVLASLNQNVHCRVLNCCVRHHSAWIFTCFQSMFNNSRYLWNALVNRPYRHPPGHLRKQWITSYQLITAQLPLLCRLQRRAKAIPGQTHALTVPFFLVLVSAASLLHFYSLPPGALPVDSWVRLRHQVQNSLAFTFPTLTIKTRTAVTHEAWLAGRLFLSLQFKIFIHVPVSLRNKNLTNMLRFNVSSYQWLIQAMKSLICLFWRFHLHQ